ncbi:hypothetical protein EMCRGX_G016521 [Ephydatia muelleri]|eukprot:Em0008g788a
MQMRVIVVHLALWAALLVATAQAKCSANTTCDSCLNDEDCYFCNNQCGQLTDSLYAAGCSGLSYKWRTCAVPVYAFIIITIGLLLLFLLLMCGCLACFIFRIRLRKNRVYNYQRLFQNEDSEMTDPVGDSKIGSFNTESRQVHDKTDVPPLSFSSFEDRVYELHAEDDKGFKEEYKKLPQLDNSGVLTVAKLPYNISKNRYSDILPDDNSRVVLSEVPGVAGSDYINANYCDGYKKENCYIVAQGPSKKTVSDFWRMIKEKRIETIVMLTKCVENYKNKCEMYWAEGTGNSFETDTFTIITDSSTHHKAFDVRQFLVTNKVDQYAAPFTVTHYHFTSWPDHGVPLQTTSMLELLREVRKSHNRGKGVPLLVHCSAGVGRTGTFVALDILLDTLRSKGTISVFDVVAGMRKKRMLMVQTEAQYMFIHDALIEHITSGERDI